MPYVQSMELVLKGILGASIAIAFTLFGRSGRGDIAGLLALFPIFSLLGYFLLAQAGDVNTLKEAVRASVIGLPVLAAFFISAWVLLSYAPWVMALLIALVIWVGFALIWIRFIL
jgi:uncharacterized membrane protein (GlpM family)